MNLRQLALVGLAVLAAGGTAVAQSGPSTQPTPPPPPPPNGNVATPGTLIGPPVTTAPPLSIGSPSPAASAAPATGRRGRRSPGPAPSASPSDTPAPPQFSTMDGIWEVQVQPLTMPKTIYSHLVVTQKGNDLSGTWIRENNQKVPFTGTFDGRLFKLTATDGKSTWTMTGYAENFSDMVGLVATQAPGDKGTPFTASHRKKERLQEVGPGGGRPAKPPG